MSNIVIPRSAKSLYDQINVAHRHPGLQLDKYCENILEREYQRPALQVVCGTRGDDALLQQLLKRRDIALKSRQAVVWEQSTSGPLTLHLSRSAALENAGICMHPVYGFVYLPGTGLKGMARAFAETVWLPAQDDQKKSRCLIEDVFGRANLSDRKRVEPDSSGSMVFHDAWPKNWPNLVLDVVNNHHSKYYQSSAGDIYPGDWEDPIPIFILAVKKDTKFSFAVQKRQSDVDDDQIKLARIWLDGALRYLGAGAKTAAGYGTFSIAADNPAVEVWERARSKEFCNQWIGEIEVVSPAFLGSANNEKLDESIELRAASLKGMLRFWWRSLYPHLDVEALKQNEGNVFGDLREGQGLFVRVDKRTSTVLRKGKDMGGGGSPLGYLGYGPIGYNREARANLTTRDAINSQSHFSLTLSHSDPGMLEEALLALWLMGAMGGVGSRTRRGWGSLSIKPEPGCQWPMDLPDLNDAQTINDWENEVRRGLDSLVHTDSRRLSSTVNWTAISSDTKIITSRKGFKDWKDALTDIGRRFQAFRDAHGMNRAGGQNAERGPDYHNGRRGALGSKIDCAPDRAAFGLPHNQIFRSLHGNGIEVVPNHDDYGRRASPLFFKVVRLMTPNNPFYWVVIHLPSSFLPLGTNLQIKKIISRPGQSTYKENLVTVDPPDAMGGSPGQQGSIISRFLDSLR